MTLSVSLRKLGVVVTLVVDVLMVVAVAVP